MKTNYKGTAGALLFIGSAQFIIYMILSEALYPGYTVYKNSVSSLGVGPTGWLFNWSIILFGAMAFAAAFLILKTFNNKPVTALLTLSGLGGMFVGIFPSNFAIIHSAAAAFAFFFGPLTAIASYRLAKSPMNQICLLLGIISLTAMVLYTFDLDLGLGWGMERMIVYPMLIWAITFGGYLMA